MKDLKILNGDINIRNGKIATVEKNDKLEQQLLKIMITTKDFYLHPSYGTTLMDSMGQGYTDLQSTVKTEIRTALDYFILLQKKNITLNKYDKEEILYKVRYIDVTNFVGDKRGAVASIGILDGTANNIDLTQNFV